MFHKVSICFLNTCRFVKKKRLIVFFEPLLNLELYNSFIFSVFSVIIAKGFVKAFQYAF